MLISCMLVSVLGAAQHRGWRIVPVRNGVCGGWMAAKILVVGYGSLLRSDDAAGRLVVRTLSAAESVETVECHQLTPELAERLSAAALAVFVDARIGSPAGAIQVSRVAAEEA